MDAPELADAAAAQYENISWPEFIRRLVLNGSVVVKDVSDFNAPWVWIRCNSISTKLHCNSLFSSRHHWAPYWLTCGVCQSGFKADFVLKVETLESDIVTLFENQFGMIGEHFLFPRVKTMGTQNQTNSRENSHQVSSKTSVGRSIYFCLQHYR